MKRSWTVLALACVALAGCGDSESRTDRTT